MRVAIIHYWLVNMRGGEKVLESLCRLYPQADIFTHVLVPERISPEILQHRITTSFINALPFAKKQYQKYLPLMPLALEQLDLRGYDLVISSESGPAKGVLTDASTPHICYCHTPMRYLWDFYQEYLNECSVVSKTAFRLFAHKLRLWDLASASRVDYFVANSAHVARRINKHYRRGATVIHPPVDIEDFSPSQPPKAPDADAPYIMIGQLVGYKATHIAVEAFNQSGKKLVIVGDGEQKESLQRLAKNNIHFAGRLEKDALLQALAQSRAFIFPGEEDFGIAPVEAMAAGKPVIAYGRGGALETVKDGVSGLFFHDQKAHALNAAIEEFEKREKEFSPEAIHASVAQFSRKVFEKKFMEFALQVTQDYPQRIEHC